MYRDEAVLPRCTTLSYIHMMLRYGKLRLSLFTDGLVCFLPRDSGSDVQSSLLRTGSHRLPLALPFRCSYCLRHCLSVGLLFGKIIVYPSGKVNTAIAEKSAQKEQAHGVTCSNCELLRKHSSVTCCKNHQTRRTLLSCCIPP